MKGETFKFIPYLFIACIRVIWKLTMVFKLRAVTFYAFLIRLDVKLWLIKLKKLARSNLLFKCSCNRWDNHLSNTVIESIYLCKYSVLVSRWHALYIDYSTLLSNVFLNRKHLVFSKNTHYLLICSLVLICELFSNNQRRCYFIFISFV